jgi:hypothetical protein
MFAAWIISLPVSPYRFVADSAHVHPPGDGHGCLAMILLHHPNHFPHHHRTGIRSDLVRRAGGGHVRKWPTSTPPVGMTVYVVHGVTGVPWKRFLKEIYRCSGHGLRTGASDSPFGYQSVLVRLAQYNRPLRSGFAVRGGLAIKL